MTKITNKVNSTNEKDLNGDDIIFIELENDLNGLVNCIYKIIIYIICIKFSIKFKKLIYTLNKIINELKI